MKGISYEKLSEADLLRIAEIDRQEEIRVGYEIQSGNLISSAVHWEVPSFEVEGAGEHTVARQIEFCNQHFEVGAGAIGAFFEKKLVGIVVVTPEIRPQLAQIAYLLVSHNFRREGIATELINMAENLAQAMGADQVYVSATPSESAIGFYMRLGFEPVDDPLPDLYELEPDDIHMIKAL